MLVIEKKTQRWIDQASLQCLLIGEFGRTPKIPINFQFLVTIFNTYHSRTLV